MGNIKLKIIAGICTLLSSVALADRGNSCANALYQTINKAIELVSPNQPLKPGDLIRVKNPCYQKAFWRSYQNGDGGGFHNEEETHSANHVSGLLVESDFRVRDFEYSDNAISIWGPRWGFTDLQLKRFSHLNTYTLADYIEINKGVSILLKVTENKSAKKITAPNGYRYRMHLVTLEGYIIGKRNGENFPLEVWFQLQRPLQVR